VGLGRIPQRVTPTLMAGRMRHRIDIVQVSAVQDTMGGSDTSLDVVWANIPASVEALSGMEKFAAHEFVSQVSHQIVIRYIGAAPSWQAGLTYPLGANVVDSNGNLQQAQGNGLSGATAPDWATSPGSYAPDGSGSLAFQWYNLGPAPPNTGVTSGMQIWFQNRQFQIEAVLNPDERNKLLVLMCIEINDSQQQTPSYPGDLE
jgi:head-tail adaptor